MIHEPSPDAQAFLQRIATNRRRLEPDQLGTLDRARSSTAELLGLARPRGPMDPFKRREGLARAASSLLKWIEALEAEMNVD